MTAPLDATCKHPHGFSLDQLHTIPAELCDDVARACEEEG